jgi:uncharacterized membrane protein
MQAGRQTRDGRTNMTKLIVAFLNYANAPRSGPAWRLPAPTAISNPGSKTKLLTANKPVLTLVILVVLMFCSHLVVDTCNTLLLVNSRRSAQQSLDVVPPTS